MKRHHSQLETHCAERVHSCWVKSFPHAHAVYQFSPKLRSPTNSPQIEEATLISRKKFYLTREKSSFCDLQIIWQRHQNTSWTSKQQKVISYLDALFKPVWIRTVMTSGMLSCSGGRIGRSGWMIGSVELISSRVEPWGRTPSSIRLCCSSTTLPETTRDNHIVLDDNC